MLFNEKLQHVYRYREFGFTLKRVFLILCLYLLVATLEIVGLSSFVPLILSLGASDGTYHPTNSVNEGLPIQVVQFFEFLDFYPSVEILTVFIVSIFFIRQIALYSKNFYLAHVQQDILKTIRSYLFEKILRSKFEFQENLNPGTVVNNFMVEANTSILFLVAFTDLICTVLVLAVYLFVLGTISLDLLGLSILTFCFGGLIPAFWIRRSANKSRELVKRNRELSDFLIQRLRSLRLVNLASSVEIEGFKFEERASLVKGAFLANLRLQLKTDSVVEPLVLISILLVLYAGRQLMVLEWATVGLFVVMFLRTLPLFKAALLNYQKTSRYIGSVESVIALGDSLVEAASPRTKSQFEAVQFNQIVLDNVSYKYPLAVSNSIDGVSVKIIRPSFICVVGKSGAGKSTLVDIISGLRSPSSGSMLVDGISSDSLSGEVLRRGLAYVPQDIQVLGETIEEHIVFGSAADRDEMRLEKVLKLAELGDLAPSLAEVGSVELGEGGTGLSGGQRQRVDIARALYGQSALIILDEPGSALDQSTKVRIINSLKVAANELNRCVIMISHDLNDCLIADEVWVMSEGLMVATGPHQTLLETSREYQTLWRKYEKSAASLTDRSDQLRVSRKA